MGINLGDIIIEGEDIYGDGVNIAARLEVLAEPGSVYISEDIYRQVHGKLNYNFDDLGAHQVKNIVQPVRVYRVGLQAESNTTAAAPGVVPRRQKRYVLPAAFALLTWDRGVESRSVASLAGLGSPQSRPTLNRSTAVH